MKSVENVRWSFWRSLIISGRRELQEKEKAATDYSGNIELVLVWRIIWKSLALKLFR